MLRLVRSRTGTCDDARRPGDKKYNGRRNSRRSENRWSLLWSCEYGIRSNLVGKRGDVAAGDNTGSGSEVGSTNNTPQKYEVKGKHTREITQWRRGTPVIFAHLKILINLRRWLPSLRNWPQTLKYSLNTGAVSWLRCPALFQHPPQIVRKPPPIHPIRFHWVFTFGNLPHHSEFHVRCEGSLTTEHFVYHHPQCIAVRFNCWLAVLETEPLRIKELWTHPPCCATFHG